MAMDVVLLKEVERLGAEGVVVSVKAGFARNYLIPSGLAVPASPQHLRAIEELARQRAQKAQRIKEEAQALKRKLESRSLTLKLSLGVDDKPFGSVTTHDLVEALRQEGFELDKHAVRLEQPIKALGIFEVPVRLHPEVTATLKVWVVKE
jgi:large subunit ribosomal protein L9